MMMVSSAHPKALPAADAKPLSIQTFGANPMKPNAAPVRSKGRTNPTVGINYESSPQPVVSFHVKDTDRAENPVEPTAMDTSETTNADSPSENANILTFSQCHDRAPNRVESPQSVLFPNSNNDNDEVNNNTNCSSSSTVLQVDQVKKEPQNIPTHGKDTLALRKIACDTKMKNNLILRGKAKQPYDMNVVPKVKRNAEFLHKWRLATVATSGKDDYLISSSSLVTPLPNLVPCDTASCSDASSDGKSTSSDHPSSPCSASPPSDQEVQPDDVTSSSRPCHASPVPVSTTSLTHTKTPPNKMTAYIPYQVAPFGPGCQSSIWVPTSRADWEDCIEEMVSVCTAAAWHRHKAIKKTKDFHAPISNIYIKDRIDIDDPLRGYQIRHSTGGWLQGFVMMTTFTTWTHYFKWDSVHPKNGIERNNPKGLSDSGILSTELESQTRSGDPHGSGVVWPTVAEIGLVGALGCGEYLVQMALDDIERQGTYDYVVLEATETSRPFYEKFGFIRVGAVSKYGDKQDITNQEEQVEIVGYRHWTYANETKARLNEHGAPSCMMARKIERRNSRNSHCQSCGSVSKPSFIDTLANYFVPEKPTIQPLGSTGRKRGRSISSGSISPMTDRSSKHIKIKESNAYAKRTASGRPTRTPTRLDESSSADDIEPPQQKRRRSQSVSRSSRNSANAALPVVNKPITQPKFVNAKSTLRKQKIANMYRDPKKTYYYNKVVTPKQESSDRFQYKSKYYFVLNYEEDIKMVRLIPLYRRGTFKGKREGREKWKATVLGRTEEDEKKYFKNMDVITAPSSKWEIVNSYMVTKCSSVAEESWDILV